MFEYVDGAIVVCTRRGYEWEIKFEIILIIRYCCKWMSSVVTGLNRRRVIITARVDEVVGYYVDC